MSRPSTGKRNPTSMTAMSTTTIQRPGALHYDRLTIALHWATVVLVALLWPGGQTVDILGHAGTPTLRAIHITLGLTLALVLVARVAWRSTGGRSLRSVSDGLLDRVAHLGHLALYAMAATTVGLGIATAWIAGDSVFGLFSFPGHDRVLARAIRHWHSFAANAILIVALGHAAVALLHQYVLRDGTLDRMLPPR